MITPAKRFRILTRDGFCCRYCGGRPPAARLEMEHIRPQADGGDNDELNVITACSTCNAGKGKRPLTDEQIIALTQHFPCAECRERPRLPARELCWECDNSYGLAVHDYGSLQALKEGALPGEYSQPHWSRVVAGE